MNDTNDNFENIIKLINEREIEEVRFERLKDTFTMQCNKCGQRTARQTLLFGLICLRCDSHLVQKNEI